MGRLIDAERLKVHYSWWQNEEQRVFDAIVDAQPTVDALDAVKVRRLLSDMRAVGYDFATSDARNAYLKAIMNVETALFGESIK